MEKMEVKDTKTQWKNLKKLINYNKPKHSTINDLTVDNKKIVDQKEICNQLNNYFVNIGKETANTIPKLNNASFKNYLNQPCPKNFKFFKITKLEVINTIKSFKNKSCSLNEIPIKIYKEISDSISQPLADLMNECINSCIYPNLLKISRITPIHKGDKYIPNNFRPISNLHKINKIFEKIIFNRLMSFFRKHQSLSENQFAYQKDSSTINALDIVMEQIYNGLNNKKHVLGIFLDQSKAFDLVNHKILLEKLHCMGIRHKELNFINNYLSERQQYVQIGNSVSNLKNISTGVPQGSTLGPLFYLLYTNDLKNCHELKDVMYADDLSLFFASENIDELYSVVNDNLKKIHTWFCANELKLNSSKSKYLFFTNGKQTHEAELKIGNNVISKSNNIKLLGINIDSKLTFSNHINTVSSKVSFVSHILSKLYYLPEYVKRKLYFSYAHPLITYGITIWSATYKNHKKSIEKVHRRLVKKINISNLNYTDCLKKHNILNIEFQNQFNLATNMHKVVYGNAPPAIKNLINENQLTRTISCITRQNEQFRKPKINVNFMKRSFDYAACNVWNRIPNDIKVPNFSTFKQKLKHFYISKL